MAVPTVVSSAEYDGASASSHAVTLPGTYSAGDVLVIGVANSSNRTPSISGWTTIGSSGVGGASNTYWFAKLAAGTEGSTQTVTLNAAAGVAAVSFALSGADDPSTNTPEWAVTNYGTGEASVDCPAVTPSDGDSLLIRGVFGDYSTTYSTPSSHTLIKYNTGNDCFVLAFRSNTGATGGVSTGTQAIAGLTDYRPKAAFTIAFAPDAAPSAPTISSVTLTGTSQIGNTLTATVVTDQDPVDSTTYQWEKASDGSGTGAADISGETSSTLALTYADFGDLLDTAAYVRCGAIATKNALPSDEAFSAWQQVTVASGGGFSGSPLKSPFLIS